MMHTWYILYIFVLSSFPMGRLCYECGQWPLPVCSIQYLEIEGEKEKVSCLLPVQSHPRIVKTITYLKIEPLRLYKVRFQLHNLTLY